jgi:hypothetical protein
MAGLFEFDKFVLQQTKQMYGKVHRGHSLKERLHM